MKNMVIFVVVVTLGLSGFVSGEVLLDETFADDMNDWTLLDTPSAGATADVELATHSVLVGMTGNAAFRYQGLMNDVSYAVPAGETLVVDFYGTNSYYDFWSLTGTKYNSKMSVPFWLVSANDYSADGFVSDAPQNAVGIRGGDYDATQATLAIDDCAYSNGTGGGVYTRVSIETIKLPTSTKHMIVTINASETKFYIEDDYYENVLSGPNDLEVLKTIATSDMFSSAQLASGLYVYLLAARHLDTAVAVGETFDGVKVTRILTPVPADCAEVISMGGGLTGDVNSDCSVDFKDLSELVQLWLDCVDPQDALCDSPWEI